VQQHPPACLIIVKVLCFRSKKEGTKPECLGFQGLSDLVLLSHNNLLLLGERKITIEETEKDRFVVTTTTETALSKKSTNSISRKGVKNNG
jgi:hypothetical protein